MTNNTPEQNTRPRFKKPVAWLLGRDLIASLQGMLLYTAFGSKLDPREWMRAKVTAFKSEPEQNEFWFDYIADSGDGMTATYSIAYLGLSNLYIENLTEEMPPDGKTTVSLDKENNFQSVLPRGEFLLVGGDTSYHLSDYATLGSRFYQPFKWAFDDLWTYLAARGRTDELENLKFRRSIFGIPGNHDYYDQLDGFRRQFLRPTKPETGGSYEANMPRDSDTSVPQLMLPGFRRLQNASYVALQLPFGWWLWGLDTEVGLIDEHQQRFFKSIKEKLYEKALEDWENLPPKSRGQKPESDDFPQKLIMATCSPTTSFGRFAREDDKKSAESFAQLKLPQPFMPNKEETTISERSGDAKLNDGQCRLDLSGDDHFYARYWGPPSDQPKPRQSDVEQPAAYSYASVVSGLGGAYHTPSQTFYGDLQEQTLYPPENVSREMFSRRLFKLSNILRGGGIGVIGFILAFAIYFNATVPTSSSQFVRNTFSLIKLEQPVIIEPTVLPINKMPTPPAEPFQMYSDEFYSREERYFWGRYSKTPDWKYFFINGMLVVSMIIIVLSAILFPKTGKRSRKKQRKGETEIAVEKDPAAETVDPKIIQENIPMEYDRFQKIFGSATQLISGASVLASATILITGLIIIRPFVEGITPFGNSMLIFLTFIWAIASAILSFRYSEWLFKQAAVREIRVRDWVLPWICAIFSVISISAGIWLFGKYNIPAYVLSDIIFVISSIGVGLAIFLLALLVGGKNFKWEGKLGMGVVGIWHAVLQLVVPFLLVYKGTRMTFISAIVLIFVFNLIGRQLMRANKKNLLLIVWFLFGALMITLPYLTISYGYLMPGDQPSPDFISHKGIIEVWRQSTPDSASLFEKGMAAVVPPLIAGFIGVIMSCTWLGWYLAVSLAFDAHNNEAGGAGRVEEFKEFVRFRLTENKITGYVIAVDKPEEKGSLLKPRLVDVFTIKVKGTP